MSTPTRQPRQTRQPGTRDRRQRCECRHGSIREPCHRPAAYRVTVVCAEPGCHRAVSHHLLCRPCLTQWRATAPRPGLLRVRTL